MPPSRPFGQGADGAGATEEGTRRGTPPAGDGVIRYFGYGSLVNRRTLAADVMVRPGRLRGFRRAWRAVSKGDDRWLPPRLDGICAVSVEPIDDPASEILGVLVTERAHRLEALDRREVNYDRLTMPPERFACDGPTAVDRAAMPAAMDRAAMPAAMDRAAMPEALAGGFYVYRASAHANRFGDRLHPITLSYVDVILQGFHDIWGEAGIAHFMATTDGWHVPILDDRAEPTYPRATNLTPAERSLIDRALADVGAEPKPLTALV